MIQCGKDNSYGHPHKETMEKLEQAAARKPSVLDNLKKAEKPEKAAPAPKRAEPEAAL